MRFLIHATPALALATGLALGDPALASGLPAQARSCARAASAGCPPAPATSAPVVTTHSVVHGAGAHPSPGVMSGRGAAADITLWPDDTRWPEPDLLFALDAALPPVPGQPPRHVVLVAAGEGFELPEIIAVLFQPDWEELSEAQQQVLAPFAPEWNTWSAAEKRSWIAFADRMQQLPADQRHRAQRRIIEWANMSPEERRIARLNYQNSRRRPMPERVKEWERYQSFTYAERERLRHSEEATDIAAVQRARALGTLPPGVRGPGQPPPPGQPMRIIILRGWQPAPPDHPHPPDAMQSGTVHVLPAPPGQPSHVHIDPLGTAYPHGPAGAHGPGAPHAPKGQEVPGGHAPPSLAAPVLGTPTVEGMPLRQPPLPPGAAAFEVPVSPGVLVLPGHVPPHRQAPGNPDDIPPGMPGSVVSPSIPVNDGETLIIIPDGVLSSEWPGAGAGGLPAGDAAGNEGFTDHAGEGHSGGPGGGSPGSDGPDDGGPGDGDPGDAGEGDGAGNGPGGNDGGGHP